MPLLKAYTPNLFIYTCLRQYYTVVHASVDSRQPGESLHAFGSRKIGTARFTLMWTATSIATQPSQFTPNHFVLLIDRRPQDSVVVSEQDNVVDETQQVPSDDSVQSD